MTREYRAKVFKSGNSVALRLPKALGLRHGDEVLLREDDERVAFDLPSADPAKIDLTGIWGSIPGIERQPVDDSFRNWRTDSGND